MGRRRSECTKERVVDTIVDDGHDWVTGGRKIVDDYGVVVVIVRCRKCNTTGKLYGNSKIVSYGASRCKHED
jgi:hypothetical protein